MQIFQQVLFVLLSAVSFFLFYKKAVQIRKNINLGRDELINDNKAARWNNVLLLAFGQKKMFQKPLVGIMHFFVYAGFVIINIEIIEIVLDGIFGTHRMFAGALGNFYPFLINTFEILALLVIIFCIVFLIRRNIVKVRRLVNEELSGWPERDANYILVAEIVIMTLFLTMNAADTVLQMRGVEHYAQNTTGNFFISQLLHPVLTPLNSNTLIIIERTSWWLHIAGIFAFLNYLPYSKHLHILLAFPNAYYARLAPMGKMENMPVVQNEVLYAMQPELAPAGDTSENMPGFGAKDVTGLSWKNLLDAYSCTECGRCTAICPANITGKLLSPVK